MRFQNKTAIVTGSSGGIGSAIVKRLASEGARIIMADRSQENASAIMEQAKAQGAPEVWLSTCDVSSEADVAATVKGAMDRFTSVDLVVNNAAIESFKKIEDLTGEDWPSTSPNTPSER